MKVMAFNGSPRKKWNTATLLERALEGAASEGAETVELVQPTDSFEMSNTSLDPEVIILIVPSAYFIGYPES